MNDPFRGRRAVITGAGSGIGRATALAFADRGAHLELADIDAEAMEAVADEARARGVSVACHVVDVADRPSMEAFAERVLAGGPPAILVNNAGVAAMGAFLDTPVDDLLWMQGVNVTGVVLGCALFLPAMVRAPGKAHLVSISSASGLTAVPMLALYSATKAAVLALSEALAGEVDPKRLAVHCVCPGFVPTNIVEGGRSSDAVRATGRRLLSRPRRGAEDVARQIVRAIERDRFFVPVYTEAWLQLGARHLPFGAANRLRRMFVASRLARSTP